ncbi:glycosyltransferase family 2 protein [Microvirga makkahensis]|uniref:Glycosyltransferase n=1 Tax=Microvirga makkahensis TaxID=1128670 RepID=A0A7X3SQX5_9HYPH|nr:glycosyltransferase [Microvirga makkahensis]MXQ13743.1 glycosyltransferase [Microvirga makkahensis]
MSETPVSPTPRIGAVAIGRNEGERLRCCLHSLVDLRHKVIYVDSGSTDHSVALATTLGCDIVALDLSSPFTAAAARNAGLSRLLETAPDCEFVQFVDGDCEVVSGWIASASTFLTHHKDYAVVCGRRRERHPDNSIYNRVCDLEWNTPAGEAEACGGDALMRVDAVRGVGGFDPALIAGEEPELCSRLRKAGWRIMRLDEEMTLHDANITRFGQWWRRTERAGWAFVNGAVMEARTGHRRWAREAVRPWVWCLAVPALALALWRPLGVLGLLPLLAYPLVMARAAAAAIQRGGSIRDAPAHGALSVIGKFAELKGQLTWIRDHLLRRPRRLIEYKTALTRYRS